ncbi:MAG: putative ABC transport system ATP-binding protein [Halothiobacillaceae bacterium]|nr:MAG: putative ABC transport system ATP-binding protein [Halothiobacillaceae bacterium]
METTHIEVRDLTAAYGERIIQQNLNFTIQRGDIFIIMGGSGCGKSSVLRLLIGLQNPAHGEVLINNINFTESTPAEQKHIKRSIGVLFQSGALFSSMRRTSACPCTNTPRSLRVRSATSSPTNWRWWD